MPSSPGGIRVNPNGQTAAVTFTLPGGGTPVAYSSASGSGTISLPATITTTTTFYFQESTTFTVSALVGTQQSATPSGTTASVDLSGGGVATLTVAVITTVSSQSASGITSTPAGNLSSTDVQSALNELDTEKQPVDSDLTAIAALSTTSFGRALLELANAAALRTSAGLVLGTDIYSKAAVDAGFQPLDSDLTAIAALTTTSYGRAFLALADGPALRAVLGTGTPSASNFLRGDGTWASAGGVAEGRAKSATVTNLSLPGVQHNGNTTSATMTANRACYTGRRVLTAITVDQIVVECTTSVASCNGRFALYAATTDWQPTGAPVIDSGTVDLSTTGIKTVTLGSPVALTPGLYVVWTNVSTGNPGLRAVPAAPSMLGFNPAGIGQGTNFMYATQTYGAPPSTPLAWDTFSYAGTSSEWIFLRESVA